MAEAVARGGTKALAAAEVDDGAVRSLLQREEEPEVGVVQRRGAVGNHQLGAEHKDFVVLSPENRGKYKHTIFSASWQVTDFIQKLTAR